MEKVVFNFDKQTNILFVSYEPGFCLSSIKDIESLVVAFEQCITQIGHRVVMISDVTNLRTKFIDQKVLECWKQNVIKLLKGPFLYGWVRFNLQQVDAQSGMNLRAAQMLTDSPLYVSAPNREEAIKQAIELTDKWKKLYPKLPYPEPILVQQV